MDELFEHFINEPEREFHVRELARIIRQSPTTVSKHLKGLERQKLLASRKERGHLLFKASQTAEFKERKIRRNILKIRRSGLLEYLKDKYHEPEAIILFGSYSKGENSKESDIDVFLITPARREIQLEEYERKLGAKIQLFVKSRKDIQRMKKTSPELLNNLVNGIVLDGFWEVF